MKVLQKILFFFFLLGWAGCDLFSSDDDPCGPVQHQLNVFANNGSNIDPPTFTTIRDGNRIFEWRTPFYENVCPNEHIEVTAIIELATNPVIPVETRVVADYSLVFEVDIPFNEMGTNGSGEFRNYKGDFGIKHAFDSDPGWFSVRTEISFNTTGNFEQDSLYLLDVWSYIDLTVMYKEFK